jgi:hypothetical protein
VPYTTDQSATLKQQMDELPSDAEFVVHVGDIRSARGSPTCRQPEYTNVANLLRRSHAPVFIVRGDNDWIDCPNQQDGFEFWENSFSNFEKNWNHNLPVVRETGLDENFSFVHKGTLFVGLCTVGGGGDENDSEWSDRLSVQATWTIDLIESYQNKLRSEYDDSSLVGRVVLFGHNDPGDDHQPFFGPLVAYVADTLDNTVPILYMNGHTHEWGRNRNFFGQSSFIRITVAALAEEPPVKMMVHSTGGLSYPEDAFTYDRML